MVTKKADETGAKPVSLVVQTPFAYAVRVNGEVVQLVKGDVVGDGFKPESIDHLRSIGFVAEAEK